VMTQTYNPKQKDFLKRIQSNTLSRINILEGSVSSGKTWISLVAWAFWVATMPKQGLYMMCAKTLTTLKNNCLLPLQDLIGESNFSFSVSTKEGLLFGRTILLEGAADSKSEGKIRGLTLQGAYCDELTLFPKDFFTMLLSRLRAAGAKLIATTNPDNPMHWLMTDYIKKQNDLDMLVVKFLIDDNLMLPNDYVTNIKKEYCGVYYDRFILGNWVAAEGCIYNKFAANPQNYVLHKVPDNIIFATIGIDFGGNGSANTFQLTGYTQGLKQVITLDEYYSKDELDATQLANEFCKFVKKNQLQYKILEAYADSAEQTIIRSFKNELVKQGIALVVKNARKGEITERIRFYNMLFGCDSYKIMSHCKKTIEAFQNAVWQQNTNKDIRLDDGKMNIDTLDAQEYSTESLMSQITQAIQVRS